MKVEWRTEPGSRAVLEIEVAEEEVAQAMDQAYAALVRRVRIPGFRPGKAPRPILERHVGTETLRDEALRRLIPRQYAEALAQAGLNPVDTPTIEVKEGPGGKGLRLTATVDVYPEVTLPDYRALRVPRESREVTEEDVDRALGDLRSRHGRLVSLPPGEPARRGDFVMIRVTASPPGLERLQPGRELLVEVGGGLLPPELEETLEGVRAGEERTATLRDPEGSVTVRVEDVRRKELPSLDDAFARAVSDQPTVAALREQLRARLAQERASEEARAFRNRVIDAVLSHTAVDVPESMVEHQVEHMVEELRERLRGRGLTLESYLAAAGKDESALRAEMKPEAERRVRVRLVLDAVAAREALTVSEQEMAAEVENLASELHQDVAKVQAWLAEEGRREALRRSLLRQKALTFLVDVVSGSPPAAGAAEAPAADPATRTPG
jgi:trigger factor